VAKLVELIVSEGNAGNGTQDNPYRLTQQFWTKDGKLVLEADYTTGQIVKHENVIL